MTIQSNVNIGTDVRSVDFKIRLPWWAWPKHMNPSSQDLEETEEVRDLKNGRDLVCEKLSKANLQMKVGRNAGGTWEPKSASGLWPTRKWAVLTPQGTEFRCSHVSWKEDPEIRKGVQPCRQLNLNLAKSEAGNFVQPRPGSDPWERWDNKPVLFWIERLWSFLFSDSKLIQKGTWVRHMYRKQVSKVSNVGIQRLRE